MMVLCPLSDISTQFDDFEGIAKETKVPLMDEVYVQ